MLLATLWLLPTAAPAGMAEAPPGEPPVRTFSMAEYNSNVQNWGAALGPDGLIYVGGGMGLLEYDGVRWTRHDTPNNSRVRVMHIQQRTDEPARIWIGSSNQFGYFQREPDGAMVYHSISDRLPEAEREFGDIRGIAEAGGAIYFQSIPMLFRWDGHELQQQPNWGGIFRRMVAIDGRVLIVVRQRLHDVTAFGWTDENPPPPLDRWRWDSLGERGQRMTFLYPWPDGRMLYGTYDHGLFWLGEGAPEPFEVAPGTGIDITTAWPYLVHRRDDGTILLATRHAGLLHLAADGALIEHVSSNNGLPMDVINGLAEDGQGGVWLPQQGVITRVALDAPLRTWGEAAGLTDARGLTEHDGRIVLATSGGLVRLDAAATDTSRTTALDSPMIEAWDVLSVDGEFYAAGSEGVHRLVHDSETGALIESERVLADHYGYRLTRSRFRPVIYAEMESGLSVLVRENGRWVDGGRVEGIDIRPHHVAEDSQGRVWAGSVLGRFFLMEWGADALKLVAELGADQGVPEGYAWPFVLGRRLVLGTFDGGYRPVFDAGGNITGVEPDPDFDNEALGEPRGVYKVASPDGVRVLAGIGDGGALRFGWIDETGAFDWQEHPVPGIEIGQNDFIQTDDSHDNRGAWIGRAPGLVRLGWPDRETESAAAPLYVTRAGDPEQDRWLRGGPAAVDYLAEDALPFSHAPLRFEYALAAFAQPDRHEYRVRLDGFDDHWSRWSAETRRDYTNLSGGNYVFRVQARDALGRVSASQPLRFSVAPPWYRTAPMLAAYAAAALLLLWIAARYGRNRRERQMLARQQELETQVADRTTEVRRQAREIREISDARAAFFANISHELRTPLTLTRAPLEELARESNALKPHQREHLDMALRNTEAMQSLIGQALDLHRLDAGKMPFNPIRADLAAALSTVAGRFRLAARTRDIELELVGIEQPCPAVFDPEHLSTMVSNLMSNALKFAPRGSKLQVRLTRHADGPGIAVIDQGPGIDPADQARIFERYQQAESTAVGGSGIGLALVRELVEMHGGRVSVESRPGEGACFELRLPGASTTPGAGVASGAGDEPGVPASVMQETPEASAPEESAPPGEVAGDWPTVLIVDDNAELRGFLRMRLGRAYRIVEAGDGREGLEKVRECLPDVVVTDGMMPVMDGLEMTQAIKSDSETDFIPVLMLTARGGPDAVVRGMQAGADDYLAKPFDSAELAARLAGLIASRRRLRERLAAAPEAAPSALDDEAANREDPFVARAREVLADHLAEPGFSVRDWADLLHMDRTTLFRKFKAAAGRSPDEDLREMRLQRAAALLRERAGNVAEVADAVGFASVSAFSRRFRERFEESPAAFARKG
ncbi:MAG: hypothetical protein CMP07_14040 [Xanthomonadales bacterium]|nr:hypothetical protein [Xanthomonadales bacterium]